MRCRFWKHLIFHWLKKNFKLFGLKKKLPKSKNFFNHYYICHQNQESHTLFRTYIWHCCICEEGFKFLKQKEIWISIIYLIFFICWVTDIDDKHSFIMSKYFSSVFLIQIYWGLNNIETQAWVWWLASTLWLLISLFSIILLDYTWHYDGF